jgi:plasmid stabilization system protein ParE
MTPPYLVTSDAAEDIDAIYADIARDNPALRIALKKRSMMVVRCWA